MIANILILQIICNINLILSFVSIDMAFRTALQVIVYITRIIINNVIVFSY